MQIEKRENMDIISDFLWDIALETGDMESVLHPLKSFAALHGFNEEHPDKAHEAFKKRHLEGYLDIVRKYVQKEEQENFANILATMMDSLLYRSIYLLIFERLIKPLVTENKTLTLALQNKEEAAHD